MALYTYIDIHAHILPGIDDGPKTLAESINMAKIYVEGGIQQVIATPHFIAGTAWAPSPQQIYDSVTSLQTALLQENIPLTIYTGMEIACTARTPEHLQSNMLLSLAETNAYLVEPPFAGPQTDVYTTVQALLRAGKKPIIAHPERIPSFQKNTQQLRRLVEEGAQLQVNIGSLLRYFDEASYKTALHLIETDMVDYLASDAHSPKKRCPPSFEDWRRLESIIQTKKIHQLYSTNFESLLLEKTRESHYHSIHS